MASFDTKVDTTAAKNNTNRVTKFAQTTRNPRRTRNRKWQGYFNPSINDPRSRFPEYDGVRSRFGEWWRGYDKAYGKIYDATGNYRSDWNDTFDQTAEHLDTGEIQDQWGDYLDRVGGYYGTVGKSIDEGGYVDKDAYDLWGNLAKGDNQAQNVQDWFGQSTMGQYYEDQANENFWRQAALGGQTYNPQEVNEFIHKSIVAPEAQQAFGNLADYAKEQVDLEQWYAQAMAEGDTLATQQIADLMNQQNQQMYQHDMTQGLGDAQLRYLLEGQLPATRTMDFTNQKIAHDDMRRLMQQTGVNKDAQWRFLENVAMPNAYDNFMWEGGMYEQALKNQESALNANLAMQGVSAGLGALGSI